MDEELALAVRYVSLNPVRAGLVDQPETWRWSSVTAHLFGHDSEWELVRVAPILERYGDFTSFLGVQGNDSEAFRKLRQSETTGRPLGSDTWTDKLSALIGRDMKPKKRGPKKPWLIKYIQ